MCCKMLGSTRQGDEVCRGTMILPSSHSPGVQSVAGNEDGQWWGEMPVEPVSCRPPDASRAAGCRGQMAAYEI